MEFTTICLLQTVFLLMVVGIMSVLFQVSFVHDFCWPNFGRDRPGVFFFIPLEWRCGDTTVIFEAKAASLTGVTSMSENGVYPQ